MTSSCKKCSWHVEKLDLPEEMLLELWALMVQYSISGRNLRYSHGTIKA